MSSTRTPRWPVVVLLLALAGPVHAQSFGFSWWKDPQFQHDLGLTAEQTAKIESIFQSTISLLRQKKGELDRYEEDLSQLIVAGADETLVTRQVDKVESSRATLNKMRTLMLLHERQVLTPDQRIRLNKLYEQMVKDRGKPRGNRN